MKMRKAATKITVRKLMQPAEWYITSIIIWVMISDAEIPVQHALMNVNTIASMD